MQRRFARRPARSCDFLIAQRVACSFTISPAGPTSPDVEIHTELDNLNILFDVHVTNDAADRLSMKVTLRVPKP